MQNKGLVITLAVCLALVSAFYLSFSFVTNSYDKKAAEYAQGDAAKEYQYLDSVAGEKVWFGYTLKECREKELNLGLDLKGGMNVTMEVSVPDILRVLSGHNTSDIFNQALALASEKQKTSGDDYLTLFFESFSQIDPNAQLASVFSTFELKDKVSLNSSNDDVKKVIIEEVQGAIDNSFNVLRTRIDRFGVVQPNIQKLIELPGIKEPERVRKLLQGSANLEFWETYDLAEILPQLAQINAEVAKANASTEAVQEVETKEAEVVIPTQTIETIAEQTDAAVTIKTDVAEKAVVAKRIAEKYSLPLIELQSAFDEACKTASADYWTLYGVHPTAFGHEIIKRLWLEAFEKLR